MTKLAGRIARLEAKHGIDGTQPPTFVFRVIEPGAETEAQFARTYFADGRAMLTLNRADNESESQFLARVVNGEALR